MRVRRVAIVLMAVGIVTSAIYATGAFSGILVSRDASVSVTGDASGYLGLKPAPGPNGAYARYGDGGQLRLTLSEAVSTENASGEGLNPGAVTTVENVFTITNQGTQSVGLWLMDGSDAVTFTVDGQSIEGQGNAIALGTGDTKPVSVEIDTRNADVNQNLLESVTFEADTDVNGQDVSEQMDDSSGEMDESESNDEQSGESQSTPTSKEKEDDGESILTDNVFMNTAEDVSNKFIKAGEAVLDAGGELLKVTGDFFSGVADWGRQKLLEKLSYVTNQPIDALKSLGETGWNTLIGFFLGEIGMPGGSFQAQESNSVFYLGGSLLSVFNPITDSVAGIRDLAAHLVKGQALYAAIEALGLLPGGSVVEDLADLKKITETWVTNFPQKASRGLQPLSDMVLKHLPTSAQRPIRDIFPDAAKRSDDASAGVRKGPDEIDENIIRNLKQNPGYSEARMKRLVNSERFHPNDLKTLAKENTNLRFVEGLSKNGVSPENIKTLSKTDANLEIARRLSNRDFSGDGLAYIAKYGDETNPKLTLERAEELKNAGYKGEDIVAISRHAETSYLIRPQSPLAEKFKGPLHAHKAQNPAGAGVTTNQLRKLREQDVPSGHVSHYVENGYSLKLVSFLRDQGHSSGRIRSFFLGSPEKVKKQVERMRKIRGSGSTGLSIAKDVYGWCKVREKNGAKACPVSLTNTTSKEGKQAMIKRHNLNLP
ncbi:hypothetical protein [Halocatena salina]|uniref:DUF1102 domain-containing protein n=1 Tax=Halocatena salina TaxID=2934340 RepID=A0A8T9ZYD8_9EURY|nr:hypothetical protein [Halocatena salina]UPM41660.1 hypothetical protein MW046_06570 [Halocatena salina]